jgi:hypothetical protein
MSTLDEIEAAAEKLPADQQRQLLLFLARRLRELGGSLPEPRLFSEEQLKAWMDEDDEDMRGLRANR